jgi:SAM-dependent methyltransferase
LAVRGKLSLQLTFDQRRDMKDTCHLYTDLAWLWPMWGDAATEYAHYCQHVTDLIRQCATRQATTLLDIGCGGGKNVLNLKREFKVTGLDLSSAMLAQAKELNPGCTFIQDDMRTFRLDQTYDAVLMDDAISQMNCRADFVTALRNAYAHLNPGGVLIATPDVTIETFEQNKTTTTLSKRDELEVVFIENVYDPDPADEQYETTILYLIRNHGRLRIETDHWTMGIFGLDVWRRILRETGFKVHEERYNPGYDEYTVFACVKTE